MARRRGNRQGSLIKRTPTGNWIAFWYDENSKRREKSTGTTDRAAAERILARITADVALRREGVIDSRQDNLARQGRRPILEHLADYIRHCRHIHLSRINISQKQSHLRQLCERQGLTRLKDLTAEALESHMANLREQGLSARTANHYRQNAIAFCAWCVKNNRLDHNPLKNVPKYDEQRDRRRVRRPLTDRELARLLAVAGQNGRRAWYLAAALAGLRRGDLCALTWSDIDFEARTITIATGKARRIDVLPMHPQLAEELRRLRQESMATPRARVFPHPVSSRSQLNDFLQAGLGRHVAVTDESGEPIVIGRGRHRRPRTKIITEDENGYVVDLHALRTTLGTHLARAGVAPQVAQKIMRHSKYETTLAHYTVLGLADVAGAINAIPAIAEEHEPGTGTDGR